MKKFIPFLILLAAALGVRAQVPAYTLQTVVVGTNSIPAGSQLVFPLTLTSNVVVTAGTALLYYTNTQSTTNTVKFTLPTTNTLYFTNSFTESNTVAGLGTNTWTVYEPIAYTNNTSYYVTNAGFTNSVATNLTTITTNKQVFVTSVPLNFRIVGTNSTTATNYTYGAQKLDVSRSASAGLLLSFNLAGAGTSSVILGYQTSLDGTLTNTVAAQTITLTAAGTGTVSTNVNLNVGPFGYVTLVTLTNANGSALTNLVLKIAQKQSAP